MNFLFQGKFLTKMILPSHLGGKVFNSMYIYDKVNSSCTPDILYNLPLHTFDSPRNRVYFLISSNHTTYGILGKCIQPLKYNKRFCQSNVHSTIPLFWSSLSIVRPWHTWPWAFWDTLIYLKRTLSYTFFWLSCTHSIMYMTHKLSISCIRTIYSLVCWQVWQNLRCPVEIKPLLPYTS